MGDLRAKSGVRLRRSVVVAVCLTCASAGFAAYAQAPVRKTMLLEPPTQLLPQRFGAWEQVKSGADGPSAATPDAAMQSVLKEDGLERSAASTYKRSGSGETIVMKAFQFFDATGAVAAYTYFRSPQGRPATQLKLGPDASLEGNGLLFRSGTTVVEADSNSALRAADLEALQVALPKVSGPPGIEPLLPTLLPAKGFDTASVKYALGPVGYSAMGGVLPSPVVGFDRSAEALTVKSKSGGVLTMLLYPTPQIAGEDGRAIETAMNQRVAAGNSAGTVKLRREGPLVLMTSGAWKASDAQKLVEGIHLRSEVSFDKPMPVEFHAEVQKTYSLLESIVIFCAISAVAMVVLALFFGGGRALIRVMQGKPAATEPEFLHIDLSGSPGKRWGDPKA
ncbi:MAG TPA: DUF6599 family protein [Acidobacteriaceae bacterium]